MSQYDASGNLPYLPIPYYHPTFTKKPGLHTILYPYLAYPTFPTVITWGKIIKMRSLPQGSSPSSRL